MMKSVKKKTAKQIFNFLPGIWKIDRRITSEIPAQNSVANGYAIFIKSIKNPHIIVYSEEVAARYLPRNATYIGKQGYAYRYDTTTCSLFKHFHNGIFFYRLNFLGDSINGMHICKQDRYIAKYTFEEDKFQIAYRVDGPFKSYNIITLYTRMVSTPSNLVWDA